MGNVNAALTALLFLAGIPLVAWAGGILTRPGRPLGGLVARHFRALVVGLVVLNVGGRVYASLVSSGPSRGVEVASVYILAALFVPMLRRLQSQTEDSLRTRGVRQAPVENGPAGRPQGDRG